MARYKPYDVNQVTLIPVSFPDQILCGSFEYALNEIVDQHIDLRPSEARYQNDETGCLAYDPAILLKIVIFGYYKGLISSRRLAEACQHRVRFYRASAEVSPVCLRWSCSPSMLFIFRKQRRLEREPSESKTKPSLWRPGVNPASCLHCFRPCFSKRVASVTNFIHAAFAHGYFLTNSK